jgi:hypothetical protein
MKTPFLGKRLGNSSLWTELPERIGKLIIECVQERDPGGKLPGNQYCAAECTVGTGGEIGGDEDVVHHVLLDDFTPFISGPP